MKIAFIGLGNMGAGIAQCILRAGHELRVWNRTPAKMQPLVDGGAKGAGSAKEAVEDAEIVMTCLMDDQSILDNLNGENGILAGMKSGAIHLCLTTISPPMAEQLQQIHKDHGTGYVSGPVAGRPDAAATGRLITFLAGEPAAVDVVKPICGAYAKTVTVLSDRPSVANCMKLSVNYFVAATIELIGEIYVFSEKCGVDSGHLNEFFNEAFGHPALKMYAAKIRQRNFSGEGGFSMNGGLKDIQMILDTAEEAGIPLELAKIIEKKMQTAIQRGMEKNDWSGTYEITRRESGLE